MAVPASKLSMLLLFMKKYFRFLVKPNTPLFGNIDVSMNCNSKCKYCLRWKENYCSGDYCKSKGEMSTEELKAVMDNMSKFPLITTTLQGAEPLLRKDLPEILQHAQEKKFPTTLITNGILLEKRIEEIAPYLSTMIISYDTPYAQDYNYIRGVPLLEKVEAGIKMAVELAKKHKFVVVTNSVLTKINTQYLPDLIKRGFEYLKVHGMSFENLTTVPNCAWENLKVYSKDKWNNICNVLIKYKKKYPIMNTSYYFDFLKKKFYYKCKPYLFCMVNADGIVSQPCTVIPNRNIDFKEPNAYEKWYENSKIWKTYCNVCEMQCILEISKLFPIPSPHLLFDWIRNIQRARARVALA